MPIAKKRFVWTTIVGILTLVLMGLICALIAQGLVDLTSLNYNSSVNNIWINWLVDLNREVMPSIQNNPSSQDVFTFSFNLTSTFNLVVISTISFSLIVMIFASIAYDKTKRENRKIINAFYALTITFSVFCFLLSFVFFVLSFLFGIYYANFQGVSESGTFPFSGFLTTMTNSTALDPSGLLGYPTLVDSSGYAYKCLAVLTTLSVLMFVMILINIILSGVGLKKVVDENTFAKEEEIKIANDQINLQVEK